ncbi:hypothetical protein ACWJJH_20135 [Endozoicomonadaceae bacterium StTr2]
MNGHAVHTAIVKRLQELKGYCIVPDLQAKQNDSNSGSTGKMEAASMAPSEEFEKGPGKMASMKKVAAGIAGETKLSEKENERFGYLEVPSTIGGLTVFQLSKQPQSPIKKSNASTNCFFLKQTRDGDSFCPMLLSCSYQLPRIGREQSIKSESMTIGIFPSWVSRKEAPLEEFLNDQTLVGIGSFKRDTEVFHGFFDNEHEQFRLKLNIDTSTGIVVSEDPPDPSDRKTVKAYHADLVIIRTLRSKEDISDKNPKKPHSINFIRVVKKKISADSEVRWMVQQTTFHVSLYGWLDPIMAESGTFVCADEHTDIGVYACLTRGPQQTHKKLAVTLNLKHLEFYGAGASVKVASILGRKPHSADMQPSTIFPHDLANLDVMQAALYGSYPGAAADFGLMKCKWPTQHEMDTLTSSIEHLKPYPAATDGEEEAN